jgi:CRP-like cAMP-binding protein
LPLSSARRPVATVPPPSGDQGSRGAPWAEAWDDEGVRVRAIGSAPPFAGWAAPALRRLARAARAVRYPPGALVLRHGDQITRVPVVVSGSVESSVDSPDGRRVVFALDAPGRAYGLTPLVDGLPMPNDVVFADEGVALEIPFEAIHGELDADPALWAGVARETNARGRHYTTQLKSVVFDTLQSRAASVLLGLLPPDERGGAEPAVIRFHLPQERLAAILGVSRQTVSALARGFARGGLVRWRYGNVTLLDPPRLQALADQGVDRIVQLRRWASQRRPRRRDSGPRGPGARSLRSADDGG